MSPQLCHTMDSVLDATHACQLKKLFSNLSYNMVSKNVIPNAMH